MFEAHQTPQHYYAEFTHQPTRGPRRFDTCLTDAIANHVDAIAHHIDHAGYSDVIVTYYREAHDGDVASVMAGNLTSLVEV